MEFSIFISSSDFEFISLCIIFMWKLCDLLSILASDMKINFQNCSPFTLKYLYPAEPHKWELGDIAVIKPTTD